MPTIWIDADAAPRDCKDVLFKAAERTHIRVGARLHVHLDFVVLLGARDRVYAQEPTEPCKVSRRCRRAVPVETELVLHSRDLDHEARPKGRRTANLQPTVRGQYEFEMDRVLSVRVLVAIVLERSGTGLRGLITRRV